MSMNREQSKYANVRRRMVEEMERQEIYKNTKYLAVVADEVPYNQILANLAYTASPCHMKHWIVFPWHVALMANAFQRPVIHVSNHIMTTHLPLSHGPTNKAPIFLVYLEGRYHYNPFQFSGSVYPAPPISQSWFKWRSNVARDWEAVIQLNQEEWDQRFPVIPGITLNLEDGSSKD
ncbi:hypothetical protein PSTG_01545 [Puccinia striiformis f. sp. tritici PST-78]|uniref:OTU domain-containing protein n=1 Tax=Puccinia striiformis f. sp. tritici PST-78 TaxID=1165861 RepID=A0A0L0W1E1_9BASI|nr:hypothetical protein PSTG_01545 [Puccinia striiformis f. sp. tritici PST-78]